MRFALGMAIKLATFLGVGVVFFLTTKIEEFALRADAASGCRTNWGSNHDPGVPAGAVFLDAAMTVVQAQRCRGFNFDAGNLVQRARRYVPVIVPVFMGALRRADGMAMALEARGFQSGCERTAYEHFTFRISDAGGALLIAVVIAGGYLALWYYGYTAVPGA